LETSINKGAEDYLPSLRTVATIALVLMLIPLPLFVFKDGTGAYVREYLGILWHLSMFFLIAKLPTPPWGRLAGFAWVILDVLSGMLYIRGTSHELAYSIRMAAHIFLGTWLMSSALTTTSRWIRICGIVAGAWLFIYSWVSPFVPDSFLVPNMPFFIAWLVLIAFGKFQKARNQQIAKP
jgi:hypothetical protein